MNAFRDLLTPAQETRLCALDAWHRALENRRMRMDCPDAYHDELDRLGILTGREWRDLDTFNLTSVEVAREMAIGALSDSTANVSVATTGILGPEDVDGIPAGTICFAWAFQSEDKHCIFSQEQRFVGTRCEVQSFATEYALQWLPHFHHRALLMSEVEAR